MFVSFMLNLLCFGLGLIDCAPQLRNICIKEILGLRGDAVQISLKPMFLFWP